ncbi:MAG: universal stress protein [Propionibacteriaceae bacterium]|jgi:nucleotide-binding universal stress UspA family protein|nr:universal stress protein [Propionibacteriaceae bacterium]
MTETTDTPARPRILIGVDGSEDGIRATRYGIGRSKRLDEDLWLVNALDDGVAAGGWGVIYDPTVLEEAGRAAVEQARSVALEAGVADDHIITSVLVGHPASVLAELSEQAEILIVGRRSASGIERMFVGSTSTSLASCSACPLVVISDASTPQPTGRFAKVAVAVGSGRSDKALRWGAKEAASRNSSLDVVHVIPTRPRGILSVINQHPDEATDWDDRTRADLERMVEPLREEFPSVTITTRSHWDVPIDRLIGETAEVDLLVLSVRARPVTGIALGGPIRGVLAHAACPVALIR